MKVIYWEKGIPFSTNIQHLSKWTNILRKYYQKQFIPNITFLGYPLNLPSGIYSSTIPVQSGKKKGHWSNPIPWEKYLGNIKNLQLSNLIKGKVYFP